MIRNRLFAVLMMLVVMTLFCDVNAQKNLVVLHTSDTHSRIEPISPTSGSSYSGKGGYVRRATIVDDVRKQYPDLLLLDCGDFSQGTPYYNIFKGELEVKMMNLMKYDAATIGNHEFDFGIDNMVRLFKLADFPIVCSNYNFKDTQLDGIVKPYAVVKRNGLTIGLIGLGPKLEGLVQAEKCEGIIYNDPAPIANELAAMLKNEKGCDVVVCLSHLGVADDEELIKATSGIDLVLGGHSHTYMTEPVFYPAADGKQIPLLHTGKSGVYVGKLKLTIDAMNSN